MASCKVPPTGLFAQGVKVTQCIMTSVARNRKVDLHLRTFNLEIPNSLKCQDLITSSTVQNSTPMAFEVVRLLNPTNHLKKTGGRGGEAPLPMKLQAIQKGKLYDLRGRWSQFNKASQVNLYGLCELGPSLDALMPIVRSYADNQNGTIRLYVFEHCRFTTQLFADDCFPKRKS